MRVCFVGDSFVQGTGDSDCLGWVGRVSALAVHRGFPLTSYNLGVRRDTSRDILARWRGECETRLPPGDDRIVVFSFGVNDTDQERGAYRVGRQETVENCQRLLETAVEAYRAYLIGPPPVADEAHNDRIARLSEELVAVAQATGTPYLPVFPVLTLDRVWRAEVASHDSSHPGSAGYARLAALIDRWSEWPFREKRGESKASWLHSRA